jgi:DNA-binding HxlR family transcriptional regulator
LWRRRHVAKQIQFKGADCPVARALAAVGERWSMLIVRDAFDGVRRFSDFQRSLGVSRGILATRLRRLVALGILQPSPASESSYQEYTLTDKGRALFPVVVGLRQWAEGHCFAPGEPHSVLVDTRTGQPVGRLHVRSTAGRALTDADTTVKKVVRN